MTLNVHSAPPPHSGQFCKKNVQPNFFKQKMTESLIFQILLKHLLVSYSSLHWSFSCLLCRFCSTGVCSKCTIKSTRMTNGDYSYCKHRRLCSYRCLCCKYGNFYADDLTLQINVLDKSAWHEKKSTVLPFEFYL